MKKEVLIFSIALILIFTALISSNPPEKIQPEVLNKINENNSAKVFIKYSNESKGISKIFSSQEETLPLEKEKIKHQFEGTISANISKDDLEKLKSNSRVESISLVGNKKIFLSDSVPLINATSSWDLQINSENLTGTSQTVCVLDTGVDFEHPDLQNKNVTCTIDCTGSGCTENCSISDDHGHGTHVAGIVGADGSVEGVAPDVNLIGVKVCDSDGNCADDDVIAGMDWCITNSTQYNISVISLSLGGGQYTNYCDSQQSSFVSPINNAISKNISVVVSTGNTDENFPNATAGISSPACIQNATRVTATDDSDSMASFAFRHQNFPDILTAPGVGIVSTYLNNQHASSSGTSMSAPHVSGAIAILQQFKSLEKNKSLTQSQINLSLIKTSKKIFDSETSTNYSRIDVYNSILSLDETPPEVQLTSPKANNTLELNQTFSCNATDSLQLSNLTLKIWNSSQLYYNKTLNATNNSLTLEENITLDPATYEWNCFASDQEGNTGNSTNITISTITLTTLSTPEDNTNTNQNQSFVCNSSSPHELSNSTFHLWNSSELIHNQTKNISGNENSSQFDYNFTSEENYSWNCLTYDNQSNSYFAESNFSITYDITKPNVTLISPENASEQTEGTIDFKYNTTDNFEIENCSLIVNNQTLKSNQSEITNSTNTISQSLSNGDQFWKINCIDKAGNSQNSSERYLKLNPQPSPSSGGGGGGGSSSSTTSTTQTLTEEELEISKTIELDKNEKLNLESGDSNIEFEITYIENNEMIFNLGNNTNILLSTGQSRKINYNNDDYYDFEIIVLNISNSKAEIIIRKIFEEIPSRRLFEENNTLNESFEEINKTNESTSPEETKKEPFIVRIANSIRNFFRRIFG